MMRAGLVLVLLAAACAATALEPARIDTANDACRHCRMIVSDVRTAAQIVAPGEEPLVFDDVGCLRDYLARAALAAGAVRFVADHRTGAWVRAEGATFTKVTSTSTPMGSGIIAHADGGSRDADPAARDGEGIDAGAILGGRR
jgi:copper chaperone NosL